MDIATETSGIRSNGPGGRLLGQLLLDGEFISREELECALAEQRRTNRLLGEVLVAMGAIDPAELKAALSVQKELGTLPDAIRAAAGVRQMLGELLLRAKRITARELDLALEEQHRTGEKLGEVMLRQGLVSREELDAVLAFQKHQERGGPSSDRLRLGEILVSTDQITRRQLEEALDRQRCTQRKLGDLLVEAGAVSPRQIARGLTIQQKLLTAALVAVLSVAGVASAQEPPAAARTAGGSAIVTVTATVSPRATMRVVRQDRVVVVTPEDVSRGYVEIPSASRLEVRCNSPNGYLLVFEGQESSPAPFGNIVVRGLGREVQIGPAGGWVPQPSGKGAAFLDLSYRFTLSRDTSPGTYAWPLGLSARPL